MSPVRFASRTPSATALPSRAAWSKIVERMNVTGVAARNGPADDPEPDHQPDQVVAHPAAPVGLQQQAEDQQHEGGRGRPELDRAGEAERDPGPAHHRRAGQVPPAERQVHRDQAEQVHPRLEQQRVRRGDVRRVDGENAAGHRGHHGAPVADQVPHQGDARGGRQRGKQPGQRERLHRAWSAWRTAPPAASARGSPAAGRTRSSGRAGAPRSSGSSRRGTRRRRTR